MGVYGGGDINQQVNLCNSVYLYAYTIYMKAILVVNILYRYAWECVRLGVAPPALEREVLALSNTPLDEGLGEGFQGPSTLSKKRAPASRTPWLLDSIRTKTTIARCKKFLSGYGKAGREVF